MNDGSQSHVVENYVQDLNANLVNIQNKPAFAGFAFIRDVNMKAIFSPISDDDFNKFLLTVCKSRISKSISSIKENRPYELDGKKYSANDVLDLLVLRNRTIYFSNNKLLNYIVYDLSQRFWYEDLKHINNMIYLLHIKFNGIRRSYGEPFV